MTTHEINPSKTKKQRRTFIAHPLPEKGLVRLPSILAVYPVSRTGIYDRIKAGKFPAPVKIGPRSIAWRVEEVREVLAKLGVAS